MKKIAKLTLTILSLATLSFVAALSHSSPSSAVTASDWRAENIINDALFTDGSGMSVSQIQAFLTKLLPSCDIYGTRTSEHGGGTRAQYGASVGNPAPFTCITSYYEVPKTVPSPTIPVNNYGQYNADGTPYIPPGSKSAAQLIYDAAQQNSINPKALIIKLATESPGPLTSDSWPLKKQYYYAMGAHCPDSGPNGAANCDVNYSGFSMQIAESAKLLRGYLDGMEQSWWPYKRVGSGVDRSINGNVKDICSNRYGVQNSNCIGWNVPERGCGGTVIKIESKATAALYTYTPYQPNSAALNNMYGEGDRCSAYGNRNFWRVWNDWFGSTQEAGYTPFFQLPGSPTTYMFGANNSYYVIDDYQRLVDYGFEGPFRQRVKQLEPGAIASYAKKGTLPGIARFEGIGVFLVLNGKLQPFPSEEILGNYGYTIGQEAALPREVADVLMQGDPLWNVVATAEGGATYNLASGKKQAMCNWDVYTKLGTPVFSSQPITTLPSRYLKTISNGAPIAQDGDVIESSDRSTYGVWSNGLLVPITAETARSSGTINCGVPLESIKQLPQSTISSPVSNTVSDRNKNTYVLESKNKLSVNKSDSAYLNIPQEKFVELTDKFTDKLPTKKLGSLVKIDGNPGVHLINAGRLYGIPSEADLFGLGYSFKDVQTVTQKTLSLVEKGGLAFKPGSVIRESSSLELYLIDNNLTRHYISSESILKNYGYSWNEVRVVPDGSIKNYSTSAPLRYYVKENDTLYWLMDRGVKRKIPNNLVATGFYAVNESNSTTLTVAVLRNYPMTEQMSSVFRAGSSPAVYIIENGKKRAFTNESAFFARGFTWKDVRSLGYDYVNSVPTGSYISQ